MPRFSGTPVEETETPSRPRFGGTLVENEDALPITQPIEAAVDVAPSRPRFSGTLAEEPKTNPKPRFGGTLIEEPEVVDDKQPEVQPSLGRVVAGVVFEAGVSEGGKLAGTTAGAAIGTAIAPVVGTVVGGIAGYITSALAFGAGSSAISQKYIEGRDDIDVGRVAVDSIINLVPGGKAVKGASLAKRLGTAAVRGSVLGGSIGAFGEIGRTAINEGRMATVPELVLPTLMGIGLGGGLGVSGEAAKGLYRKYADMSPDQFKDALRKGGYEEVQIENAINEAAPVIAERAKGNMSFGKRIAEYSKDLVAGHVPSARLGKIISGDMTTFTSATSSGQGQTLEKILNTIPKNKELQKPLTIKVVDGGVDELGAKVYQELDIKPGQVLQPGTKKHAEVITYVTDKVTEGEDYFDPIMGRSFRPSEVSTGADGQARLQWKRDNQPDWMGPTANKIMADVRFQIRETAQTMIDLHDAGIRLLSKELYEKIAKSINEDNYLPRQYAFFTVKNYDPSKKLSAFKKAMMASSVDENGKKVEGLSEKEFGNLVGELERLRAGDPLDTMDLLVGGRVAGTKVLKKRTLTDSKKHKALREYLGEVKNPAVRISDGYMQMQRYVAEALATEKVTPFMFANGIAKQYQDIPQAEISAGLWTPMKVGGVKVRTKAAEKGGATMRTISGTDGSSYSIPNKIEAFTDGGGGKVSNAAMRGDSLDNVVYIPKGYQAAINSATGMGVKSIIEIMQGNIFTRAFLKLIAASKIVKVPFNPPSYMLNAYSGMLSTAMNGFSPLDLALLNKGRKASQLVHNPSPKNLTNPVEGLTINDVLDLQRRGVLDQNIASREFTDIIGSKDPEAAFHKKFPQKAGEWYSFLDNIFRMQNYYKFEGLAAKAGSKKINFSKLGIDDATRAQLEKAGIKNGQLFSDTDHKDLAQIFTRSMFMNYDMVNKGLRSGAQLGIPFSQFANFAFNLAQVSYHKVMFSRKFIDGSFAKDLLTRKKFNLIERGIDDKVADKIINDLAPQMIQQYRKHGMKMTAAQIAAYTSVAAGVTVWNRTHGIDEQLEKETREFVPSYDRNEPLAIDVNVKNRTIRWKNTSYLTDIATITNIFTSMGRGESMGEALANAANATIGPIYGKGPFIAENFFPAFNNYDPHKRDAISTSPSQLIRTIEQSAWYLNKTFQPGFIREYDRATSPTRNQDIKTTLLRQVGIRWNERKIEDLAYGRIAEIQDTLNTSRRRLRSDLKYKNPSLHAASWQKHNADYQENFKANIRLAQAMNHYLKVFDPDHTPDDTILFLKEHGMPSSEALASVKGFIPELPRSISETPLEIWEEIRAKPANERKAAINAIEEPSLKRNMMRRYRNELKDQRRGISNADNVVRNMSVEERANYIFQEMQQSSNSQAVLNDYRRKRIATPNVLQQIRTLEQAR